MEQPNTKESDQNNRKENKDYVLEGESHIREIIPRDDKYDFLSFLESSSAIKSRYSVRKLKFGQCELSLYTLLGWICSHNAVACATALFAWTEQMGKRVNLNVTIDNGKFWLHEAANSLCCGLTELFLDYGAKPDVRCKATDSEDYGLRPLDFALRRACSDEHLIRWTPKQSVLKLIILLCLPKMQGALDSIKLLAWRTKEVNLVFHFFAIDGKLIQLAILLMVAWEKVIEPNMPADGDFGFTGCLTFRQSLRCELAKVIDEEFSLMGKEESRTLVQTLEQRKEAIISALQLLEIFERAGEIFDDYCERGRFEALTEQQVIEEVSWKLEEVGFVLEDKDIDLSDVVECRPKEPALEDLRDLEEESDTAEQGSQEQNILVPLYSQQQKPMHGMPNEYGGLTGTRFLHGSSISSFTGPFHPFRISKGSFHSWSARTMEFQVKQRTGGLIHYVQSFPSRKQLASFVSVVKRGIRRA